MILEKKLLRDPDRQIYMGNSIQFDSLIVLIVESFCVEKRKARGDFCFPHFWSQTSERGSGLSNPLVIMRYKRERK